jgi:hypothetical protein
VLYTDMLMMCLCITFGIAGAVDYLVTGVKPKVKENVHKAHCRYLTFNDSLSNTWILLKVYYRISCRILQ